MVAEPEAPGPRHDGAQGAPTSARCGDRHGAGAAGADGGGPVAPDQMRQQNGLYFPTDTPGSWRSAAPMRRDDEP